MPRAAHLIAASTRTDAYRDASIRPLCSVCHALVLDDTCCPRCAAPLCATHDTRAGGPGQHTRCPACESQFGRLRLDRERLPVPLLALIGIDIVLATAVLWVLLRATFWRPWPLATGALLTAVFAAGPLAVALHRRRRLRRVFLTERPDRRRLRYHVAAVTARPATRPAPRAEAVVAFVLSLLLFYLPPVPIMAAVAGIYVLATPHRGRNGRGLALAAFVLGVLATAAQLALLLGPLLRLR